MKHPTTHIFGNGISEFNLAGLSGEQIYEHQGSRAVGEQEDVVFQGDLGNLTAVLVGLNFFEWECI
jgi:hypothetical protein